MDQLAKNNARIFLKGFLDQLDPESKDCLIAFLPEITAKSLVRLPSITIKDEDVKTASFEDIHWSWFIPYLSEFEEKDQKLFLHAFHPMIQKSLSKHLKISVPKSSIGIVGVNFLRKQLITQVANENLLPMNYLPESGLNLLLKIEKKKLTQLIDLMSLFDFAAELKQIVETKILNKIYSFLSQEELFFLKTISGQKEPYPPAQIHLNKWDQSKESLRKTMHKIGLVRLGNALAGQDPNLIWYVCHRLDIGRGQTLEKLSKHEAVGAVANWLTEQLKELL